ncbi:hypothetical protein [Kitasatospora sp. NPDC059827]|uniref:hypothetical protein n=1 Tax=Kitasatospora sp. NPDC059827 TaxID=3346964 RepID=UPI00365AD7C2
MASQLCGGVGKHGVSRRAEGCRARTEAHCTLREELQQPGVREGALECWYGPGVCLFVGAIAKQGHNVGERALGWLVSLTQEGVGRNEGHDFLGIESISRKAGIVRGCRRLFAGPAKDSEHFAAFLLH